MKNVTLAIALVGALGLLAGCSGFGGDPCAPCEPDPCCEPVYVSPCCPAPSQGIGYTSGGYVAPAGGGWVAPAPSAVAPAPAADGAYGSCGGGKACG